VKDFVPQKPINQEFPENPYPLFVPAFLEDRPTENELLYVQKSSKYFVFGKNVRYSVKKSAEYLVRTNYSADTEYSVLVKSRIFGYSVIR
jgi:hypothetical protein